MCFAAMLSPKPAPYQRVTKLARVLLAAASMALVSHIWMECHCHLGSRISALIPAVHVSTERGLQIAFSRSNRRELLESSGCQPLHQRSGRTRTRRQCRTGQIDFDVPTYHQPRIRLDYTKTPCKIPLPSRLRKKSSRPRFYEVFNAWLREVVKPDFSIHHAAKAIRLLPEIDFTGLVGEHRLLNILARRTKQFLVEGNVGTREVLEILDGVAGVQKQLPQMPKAILPDLLPLVPQALHHDLKPVHVLRLARAASKLQSVAPELQELLSICSRTCDPPVEEVSRTELIPDLVEALSTIPAKGEGTLEMLTALQDKVRQRLDGFDLPQLAWMLWKLQTSGVLGEQLLSDVSAMVVKEAGVWNYVDVEPHLWQIACIYAHRGLREPKVLRALARRATTEGLERLSGWSLAALTWAYGELAEPKDGFAIFRRHLDREISQRRLTQKQIADSRLGRDGGGDKKLLTFWKSLGPRSPDRKDVHVLAPVPSLKVLRPATSPPEGVHDILRPGGTP